jgi:CRP-like cAMP-binding protein
LPTFWVTWLTRVWLSINVDAPAYKYRLHFLFDGGYFKDASVVGISKTSGTPEPAEPPAGRCAVAYTEVVSLLEIDPELALLLPSSNFPLAGSELSIQTVTLPRGDLALAEGGALLDSATMLFILSGFMTRSTEVGNGSTLDLFCPGDLVPIHGLPFAELVVPETKWTALSSARVAVIDQRVMKRMARYPDAMSMVFSRLALLSARQAMTNAIAQISGIDKRLLTLFQFLADEWGKMCTDGVRIDLPLSHAVLAGLVGSRRPTVSHALAALAHEGTLTRKQDGSWLLLRA